MAVRQMRPGGRMGSMMLPRQTGGRLWTIVESKMRPTSGGCLTLGGAARRLELLLVETTGIGAVSV